MTATLVHRRRPAPRAFVALLLAGLVLPLAACQSLGGPGRVSRDDAPVYVERPVDVLYNEARDNLARGRYAEAVTGFEEVDRQHPYSEWSSRSILMAAYANYQQSKYEEAIAACQRYIGLYRNTSGEPYAYYLIAVSYFEQIVDVGRDQRMTELALAALNEVVQRFPGTPYAQDASLKMDMARDQLAGKEMEIGRYYLTQNQHLAAIGRFRRVVDLYQTTSHVPEALHRLVEAYLSIGVVDEATRVGAVLGYNFPGSEWYQASYDLLTAQEVRMAAPPRNSTLERLGIIRYRYIPRRVPPPDQPMPSNVPVPAGN